MKQDGSLPVRLTFRPSAARFFTIVTRSQTAIDWTLAEGTAILDHWLVGMYSLLYATYVQCVYSSPIFCASLLSS